ncbi:MAG: efflux RND transporter periplasmic adaptor subunit [Acidobacteria bacterium]|nr:efflux RND transporter periplasmic adaptor subunit [Acidobacteriota bacterium]
MKTPANSTMKGLAMGLVAGLVAGGGVAWALLRKPTVAPTAAAPAPTKKMYQCPMHPQILQDHPGSCPICGMDLVLMEGEGGSSEVEGQATVTLSPERQQLMGLRFAEVAEGPMGGGWRAPGRVTADETRVRKVALKVEGYLERLRADFVGKPVRAGEPLFEYFSHDLLAAQKEFALALRNRAALGEGMVEASRQRLRVLDVPEAAIAALEAGGAPQRTQTYLSPVTGIVTAKSVVEGQRLPAGETAMEVTDLGVVWVAVDLFEADAPRVKVGQGASFNVPALGRSFRGQVAFLDAGLNAQTRTLRARITLANPGMALKPEMLGEVSFEAPARKALTVPVDAVLDSGKRRLVFVDLGQGRLMPKVVELGERGSESVEVRSGLMAGERVVRGATFLVDSESRLKAVLQRMTDPGHAGH